MQILRLTHPSLLNHTTLPWNMIIFSPTLLLSTNGLRCCISTVKLPYITLSLHTFYGNCKSYALPTFHPQPILPLSWNMIIFSPNMLLSTNGLRHCISIVKLPYITLSLHTCHVNCKPCDLPPLNHTTPIMKYDNTFPNFAPIYKWTSLLHFRGKTTLCNIIAALFPYKLQILRPAHFSSPTHTTLIMKYDNLFPNFALIM